MTRAIILSGLFTLLAALPARAVLQDPPLTFSRDIAPIIFENCSGCHRPGESAPFPLLSYQDVRKRARQIVAVTSKRYMPPWLPAEGYGEFAGERRLSRREIEEIRRWAEQGAPEGDPAQVQVPQFPQGWQLGVPDLVVRMAAPYTLPAEGFDVFRNFVIPLPVGEPHYVRAVELRPGNPKIVHHAVMQVDHDGSARRLDAQDAEAGFPGMEMGGSEAPQGHILSWTPGKAPSPGFEGLAWKLEPGSDLVLQLHMLPSGRPEQIQPSIGFYFADRPPARQAQVLVLRENDIDIPAGEKDYRVRDQIRLPAAVEVLSIYPHAHYLGKEMQVYAELPEGGREWLLRIPDWDFNWQDQYRCAKPVLVPAGAALVMEYSFDNSASNPRNPRIPPRRVVHGGRSTDEMATLALQVLPVRPEGAGLLREAALRHVIQDPSNPHRAAAHHSLAVLLESRGELDEAIVHYREALRIDPDDFRVRNNLGAALKSKGRLDEAVQHFQAALRLEPDNLEALNNLGAVLGSQGRLEEAADCFRRALQLDPDNAELHNNLGNALAQSLDEAIEHYRQAVRLRPDYAEAHNNLGVALAGKGELEEALKHFRRALEIRPGYEDAGRNLKAVSGVLGKGR